MKRVIEFGRKYILRLTRRSLLYSSLEKSRNSATGLHRITADSSVDGFELTGETELECSLFIPGTNYQLAETMTFYPGN